MPAAGHPFFEVFYTQVRPQPGPETKSPAVSFSIRAIMGSPGFHIFQMGSYIPVIFENINVERVC